MTTFRHVEDPVDQVTFAKGALSTGAVVVTNAAGGTLIVAADTARTNLLLINTGTQILYVGAFGVTTATGIPIQPQGGWLSDDVSTSAYWGIVAAGNVNVRYEVVV